MLYVIPLFGLSKKFISKSNPIYIISCSREVLTKISEAETAADSLFYFLFLI